MNIPTPDVLQFYTCKLSNFTYRTTKYVAYY